MPQIINTNVMSLNSQRNLNKSQGSLSNSLERLSSGLRINSSKDDAAGLAVAMKMDSEIRGMTVAVRNASDGISYAQVADAALDTVAQQLQRMRELATQSLNGTLSDSERSHINQEFDALQTEAARVQAAAKLNGQQVYHNNFSFQVGASVGDSISGSFSSVTITGASVTTSAGAADAMGEIDRALSEVAASRAIVGGVTARLNFTISYLEGAIESQTAAKSRIMDADFAAETAALTRAQILQQAGVAMVSQANSVPQNVLSLLR